MGLTIPVVEASNPQGLIQTAASLGQDASGLSAQIDTQRASIDGLRDKWQGPASGAAYAKAQQTLQGLQRLHDGLTGTQSAMHEGGTALAESRTNLLRAVDQLKARGWQVAADGTVSAQPGGPLDTWAKLSPGNQAKIDQLAANGSVLLKTELANFDTADRRLDGKLRNATQLLDFKPEKGPGGDPLPEGPGYDTGDYIPVGKSPEEVKKWWDGLPPEEKDRLTNRDWLEKIGNLNGIPIADRSTANKHVMERDLKIPDEIAKSRGVTRDEVLAHPELYGFQGTVVDRYNNAVKVNEALQKDARDAKDIYHKTPDILLMKYDPEAFGGKGSAAIAIGNPDKADNTSVTVSGLTTSVASGTLADGSGVHLYNEATKAEWNKSTAVIQWMGYDAPNDTAVAEPNMARNGGQLLASDVNALAVTHEGNPSHTTVIGHSYGSTTVSDAAAGYGMHANDVVLIGCPGTDLAKSAADFHLPPGGHLYVGAASTDVVTHAGSEHINLPGVGLGNDPAMDGYGSTRFHAEVADWNWNPISAAVDQHTSYYKEGSESLFSMADVVSGHGDALDHDGMTAEHRRKIPFFGDVVDPDTLRFSNNDHHHTGPGG